MPYRISWWENKGVLCAWWFLGLAVGGTTALSYRCFLEIWQTVGLVLLAGATVAAPFAGVWATRLVVSRLQKGRKRRLRGAEYADYAYIL